MPAEKSGRASQNLISGFYHLAVGAKRRPERRPGGAGAACRPLLEGARLSAKKLTLWSLTWPLFVEQGLRISIGTVDTLMVSHVSDNAVAALGEAWQVVILSLILFNFIGIGSSVVITHHLGAGD